MKRLYIILAMVAFLTLSVSQIFLWRDQTEQWQMLNRQMLMLNRVLDFMMYQNNSPRMYEDEIPNNDSPVPSEDI